MVAYHPPGTIPEHRIVAQIEEISYPCTSPTIVTGLGILFTFGSFEKISFRLRQMNLMAFSLRSSPSYAFSKNWSIIYLMLDNILITQQNSEQQFQSDSDDEQPAETRKIKRLLTLKKEEFGEIKRQFGFYGNVSVALFVSILQDLKKADVDTLVRLFQLIDIYETNSITFEQFSNFLVDMHDWINRDQSLFQLKLRQRELDQVKENNTIEKLFALNGYEHFAYLEQNLKQLHLLRPKDFEEQLNISIGSTVIVNALYIKTYHSLVLLTNDKFINFYDLNKNELQRRFLLPELQSFLQFSKQKDILYTGTVGGVIYSWNMEKIFSKQFREFLKQFANSDDKQFSKQTVKMEDCFKIVIVTQPIEQQKLSCMLNIDSLEIVVTGSSDTVIRLYENKKVLTGEHKCLKGHKKAIKHFSYCKEFKYLISCSYDFDVLIWNIYLEHPLAKLMGHEASLISVIAFFSRASLIVSCDIKGTIKVWDPKTFQSIQHIKIGDGKEDIKSVIYKKEVNQIIVGCKKLMAFEFDQSFDPNLTDDNQIVAMCYANKYLELHLATATTLKTWDIQHGLLKRVSKGYRDIQTFIIDKTQRRGFIGSQSGQIICIDLFTGHQLREINDFSKEISFLAYSNNYQLWTGISWDKQIRIYKDGEKDVPLRTVKNAHPAEITCAHFSDNLMLLVTVGRLQELRIWDFEKGTFMNKLKASGEIVLIKFLDPYPMFATSDHQGTIVIYMTPPSPMKNKVAIIWKNMFTIMKAAQVNAIELHNETLILGDENGDIRILQIKDMITQLKIERVNHSDIAANKNPLRFFQLNFQEYEQQSFENMNQMVPERTAYQILVWKAYKYPIRQLELIHETKKPTLVSLALDFQVKLWDLNGNLIGILRQGAKLGDCLNLHLVKNYQTVTDKLTVRVKAELNGILQEREVLKKSKRAPFKYEPATDDLILQTVDSKAIFQTLKQLEEMQEKQQKSKTLPITKSHR